MAPALKTDFNTFYVTAMSFLIPKFVKIFLEKLLLISYNLFYVVKKGHLIKGGF